MNVSHLEFFAKREPLIENFAVIKGTIVFSVYLPTKKKPSLSTGLALIKISPKCQWSLNPPTTFTTGQSASEAENIAIGVLKESIRFANSHVSCADQDQAQATHTAIRVFFDDLRKRFHQTPITNGSTTALLKKSRRNYLLDYLTKGM